MEKLNLSGLPFASRSNSENDEFQHDHSFVECFFICEGAIIHQINGTEDVLSTGDGIIIAPDFPHSFKRFQPCIHRDNMLSPELFKECCDFMNKPLYDELQQRKYIKFHVNTDRIQFFERSVIAYISSSDVFQKQKYERFLASLLMSYITLSDFYEYSALNDFQSQCTTLLSQEFMNPNAIELIADKLHFNRSYLCKKFKATFGVTMTEYVNTLRVKHAAYLLAITEYPLIHICELIGIESLPYFNKLFKEHYHTTPAKYRKLKNNQSETNQF